MFSKKLKKMCYIFYEYWSLVFRVLKKGRYICRFQQKHVWIVWKIFFYSIGFFKYWSLALNLALSYLHKCPQCDLIPPIDLWVFPDVEFHFNINLFLRVEPMKIDFRVEISVCRNFDLKNFFKIPLAKIKVFTNGTLTASLRNCKK